MSLSLCWKTFAFSRTRVTVTPNCIPIECRWTRRKGTRIAVYFSGTTFHYLLNPSRYDRDRFSEKLRVGRTERMTYTIFRTFE